MMFLDLHDSTRHAERLGDVNFHSFLNLIFFDMSDPVLAARGSIYRYVGDEIIITWPLERGTRDAACIAANACARNAAGFLVGKKYGAIVMPHQRGSETIELVARRNTSLRPSARMIRWRTRPSSRSFSTR
ncbi:MAG TPA: hypothetical protein VGI28_07290 [Stellaceae bacterium]